MAIGSIQNNSAEVELEVVEEFYRPKALRDSSEMDITPMIDITFLLLIFFLVSSRMTAEQAVELPKARHGEVVPVKESAIIVMRRGTGDSAEVLRTDGTRFSSDTELQNAEIAEYIAAELAGGKKHVIIRAEGSVRHGEIGRVSRAISQALEEGDLINIAVIEQS
jgi:biopolymer transport protein ExbD